MTPVFDPVAALVYSARGCDVETVIVDGQVLMDRREVRVFDEGWVVQEARRAAANLVERVPALARLANGRLGEGPKNGRRL